MKTRLFQSTVSVLFVLGCLAPSVAAVRVPYSQNRQDSATVITDRFSKSNANTLQPKFALNNFSASNKMAATTLNQPTNLGTYSILHNFTGGTEGGMPVGNIVQVGNYFYGTNTGFPLGDNISHIFRFTATGNLINVYTFPSNQSQGNYPRDIMLGKDGNLYGNNMYGGGALNGGTIFKFSPASRTLRVLYSFNSDPEQRYPAPINQALNGNFYGTTNDSGEGIKGTIFRLTPQGQLTTLHYFQAGPDGANPNAGLIQASNGYLYGTTGSGGNNSVCGDPYYANQGCGTIYRIRPNGSGKQVLHYFKNTDGSSPRASLIQATNGYLYGTTYSGGAYGLGTVFRISLNGTFTRLYSFRGSDGAYPSLTNLIQASDGNLYGTTLEGGIYNQGTIFRITMSGKFTRVHSFNGQSRPGGVIQGKDGNLYGHTQYGGIYDRGTVFKLNLGLPRC